MCLVCLRNSKEDIVRVAERRRQRMVGAGFRASREEAKDKLTQVKYARDSMMLRE